MSSDFEAYLDAKRDLDERSLHRPTWSAYIDALGRRSDPRRPPSVLELGAGLGAMLERTRRDFGGGLAYLALDASAERLEILKRRCGASRGKERIDVETRCGDALEAMEGLAAVGRRFDAVVSHAFIDLVDIPRLAAAAARLLVGGGVFYNSLVFDGVTAFLTGAPAPAPFEDERYVEAYHRSMRRPWDGIVPPEVCAEGGAGRRLLTLAARPPWTILSAGPSDWLLPPRRGDRSADEERVVARMLGFFQESVGAALGGAERADFISWLERKRAELRDGGLGYYAHNLDVLAALRD